jgi:hypothetical protein
VLSLTTAVGRTKTDGSPLSPSDVTNKIGIPAVGASGMRGVHGYRHVMREDNYMYDEI